MGGIAIQTRLAAEFEELSPAHQRIWTAPVNNIRFIQQGSSCTGFSTSPLKGLRYVPTHVYHKQSDTDFRMVSDGMEGYLEWYRQTQPNGDFIIKIREGLNMLHPESAAEVFPELNAFSEEWRHKIRSRPHPIQFTVLAQDRHFMNHPFLWDLPCDPRTWTAI